MLNTTFGPRLFLLFLIFGISLLAWSAQAETSQAELEALLRRVAQNQKRNRLLEMSYLYEMTSRRMKLDATGAVRETELVTYEVIPLKSGDYRRVIGRDGQPLSAEEARKEQSKLERSLKKEAQLSESERLRQEKKWQERRRKEEQTWEEVVKAFTAKLVTHRQDGETRVTVVDLLPRSDYIPPNRDLRILKKVKGRVWIDNVHEEVTRAEMEFVEDVTFGAGILGKLNQGGTLSVQLSRINDEVWLPRQVEIAADGRILFKGFRIRILNDFANYRKFETSVQLGTASLNP
ncbi:MAG: hypothetical protein AB1898_08915 [Acidobacteriota bacterium]